MKMCIRDSDSGIEPDGSFLSSFYTTSISAYETMESELADYTRKYPDIILDVTFQYECDDCPSRWVVKDGSVSHHEGCVVYDDDEDEILFAIMRRELPKQHTEGAEFWTDGEQILGLDEAKINAIADLLDASGYCAVTGHYDPKEDAVTGEADAFTGFYYVTV